MEDAMTVDPVEQPEDVMFSPGGYPVNKKFIRAELLIEDELVKELIAEAQALHARIAAAKTAAFDKVAAFNALMAQQFGVTSGGRRGGVELTSFDGLKRVVVSVANSVTFGHEIVQAKALIDECLTEWTKGGRPEAAAIINSAFDVGEGGKLQVDRILALRKLTFDDPRWGNAMAAINLALRVDRSRSYIRFYERESHDAEFRQVVLDASRV